jgi:hypothetical protein
MPLVERAPEIVSFAKSGGLLSKKISLDSNGRPVSDGSACIMARGSAHRVALASVGDLAALISAYQGHEALALGRLRDDLPDRVSVVTKAKLNGAANGVIARTIDHINYQNGRRGFVLDDFDSKGMPEDVMKRVADAGGFAAALAIVLPALTATARVIRASTSAGLYRADTGIRFPGSNGVHLYLAIANVADSERFLRALHDRCWLSGFGWYIVGAGGQLLERSIVDRMVGRPERLVFEGPPALVPPLAQDSAARKPEVVDGAWLDTLAQCPPLDAAERSWLAELRAKSAHQMEGERARVRDEYIRDRTQELAQRRGITQTTARVIIERQCQGILLPGVVLPFDDEDLRDKTVADVLANPDSFLGETLADPLEGVGYGRNVARIQRRANGTVYIHSFAHGRTIYELRLDAGAVRAACERLVQAQASANEIVNTLIRLLLVAEINQVEASSLVAWVHEKTGVNKLDIRRMLKDARAAQTAEQEQSERKRRTAERSDPRPAFARPEIDAPFLPEMNAYNDVTADSDEPVPPARNIDGAGNRARMRPLASIHAFATSNEDASPALMPAPEQWVIVQLSEEETAEMLERHIDFVDKEGRSAQCPRKFVRHFMKRDDGKLPYLVAIATLPVVLADGPILLGDPPHQQHGLNRERGIAFMIEPEIMRLIPERKACTRTAVGKAMGFLADDWLADVATDLAGKAILIAMALTIIERSLLDQRPAFWVTAGQRGNGKTTTLQMITEAVTGIPASAAAWSPNEEERRKALLGYFDAGMPYILWDNIPRGSQIACPHIERSCTSAYYTDRKLGVSEVIATSAATIHLFTGNNIGPKGDLASRSLLVRLEVDQTDPENREFKHPDPLGWTRQNRGEILKALFTILLGNPSLKLRRDAEFSTRFKMWQRLVGSAVEHAVECLSEFDPSKYPLAEKDGQTGERPKRVEFKTLFSNSDADDEDATSLGELLDEIRKWRSSVREFSASREESDTAHIFNAAALTEIINDATKHENREFARGDNSGIDISKPRFSALADIARDFLFPSFITQGKRISPNVLGKRLKSHVGRPVDHGGQLLVLRTGMNAKTKCLEFWVTVIGQTEEPGQ